MNQRKNHNSILFLTTLGVYLGLVLVGATPVLAQSVAPTSPVRQVDLPNDSGQKPDERSPVTASVQIYLEDIEYFLDGLSRLQKKGKFDFRRDQFGVLQNSMLPCVAANIAGSYTPVRFDSTSDAARPVIEIFSRGMVYGYSLGDCLPNDRFNGAETTDSHYDFALDNNAFAVNVSVKKSSPQRAIDLQRELEGTIRFYATKDASKIRSKIIEKTTFKTENDQIFIRIRLPRGSLDTLLANSAK